MESNGGMPQAKKLLRSKGYLKVVGATIGICALVNGAWNFSLQSQILKYSTTRSPGTEAYVSINVKGSVYYVPEELAQAYQTSDYIFWGILTLAAIFLVFYFRQESPIDRFNK